ncbi:MAG: hypothetical protein JSS20_18040, partial [Proteobacteria bacterium]|nr:hypothetical protein [Pseudomonadota bacterium]
MTAAALIDRSRDQAQRASIGGLKRAFIREDSDAQTSRANGGTAHVTGGGVHLNGATNGAMTIDGTVQLDTGSSASLSGEFDFTSNGKLLTHATTSTPSTIVIEGATTWKGPGGVEFSDTTYTNNLVQSNGASLNNQTNVSGAAQFVGTYTFTNEGAITSTGTQHLAGGINDDMDIAVSSFTNAGTLHASTGSEFSVQTDGPWHFTNLTGGILTGGTYLIDDQAVMAFGGGNDAPISTLAADVALGSGSVLEVSNGVTAQFTTLENSLTTIASGAHLSLFAHDGTWANAIVDHGSLNLNNDVFTDAQGLTIAADGGAGGFGEFNAVVADLGTIVAGGALKFDQAVSGTGTVTFLRGSSVEFAASSSVASVSFDVAPTSTVIDTLYIDDIADFSSTIQNFASNDRIVIKGHTLTSASLIGPNTLELVDASGGKFDLKVAGDFTGKTFTVNADGSIGLSTLSVPTVAISTEVLANDTGASSSDGITKDGHVTLTGTVAGGAGGYAVHIFDGKTDLGAATVSGDTWSFTGILPEGTHNLTAVATDSASQTATSTPAGTIVVDTTA